MNNSENPITMNELPEERFESMFVQPDQVLVSGYVKKNGARVLRITNNGEFPISATQTIITAQGRYGSSQHSGDFSYIGPKQSAEFYISDSSLETCQIMIESHLGGGIVFLGNNRLKNITYSSENPNTMNEISEKRFESKFVQPDQVLVSGYRRKNGARVLRITNNGEFPISATQTIITAQGRYGYSQHAGNFSYISPKQSAEFYISDSSLETCQIMIKSHLGGEIVFLGNSRVKNMTYSKED